MHIVDHQPLYVRNKERIFIFTFLIPENNKLIEIRKQQITKAADVANVQDEDLSLRKWQRSFCHQRKKKARKQYLNLQVQMTYQRI